MTPKFRARVKTTNCIMDVLQINFNTQQTLLENGYWYGFTEIEFMQSTGLKDKNDREIFEGDLVKYEDCILQIVWAEWSSGVGLTYEIKKQENKNVSHDIRMYRTEEEWEVIGNIYENPEVLV